MGDNNVSCNTNITKMKQDKRKFDDDNLLIVLAIMFFVAVFGYNLKNFVRSGKQHLPGIRTTGSESFDTAMIEGYENTYHPKVAERKKKKSEKTVTVTRYNPVPEQCDSDPLKTADNSKINLRKLKQEKLRWVAVSQDLLSKYNYGDKIKLESKEDPSINGIYTVHDCMNKRFTNRVDILTHPQNDMGRGLWNEVKLAKI
jgi:3D (Asp-Asp-Asp) domain-containing protein